MVRTVVTKTLSRRGTAWPSLLLSSLPSTAGSPAVPPRLASPVWCPQLPQQPVGLHPVLTRWWAVVLTAAAAVALGRGLLLAVVEAARVAVALLVVAAQQV